MPEMPSGNADSPSKGTIAIGMAVPAPPTISMVSCARAAAKGDDEQRDDGEGEAERTVHAGFCRC